MSTIAVEMASKKPTADAELEELDVREVSIVDRPANRRKFLIVKRDAAGLSVLEEDMPNTVEVIKDDTSLLELLGLSLLQEDDDQDTTVAFDEPDLEAITKADIAAAGKVVEVLVGRLSKVVSTLKGSAGGDAGGDANDADKKAKGEVDAKVASEIKSIAKTLAALVGKLGGEVKDEGKEAAKKADSSAVLKVASQALSRLMSVASKMKSIDKGASEVPSAIVSELGTIAVALAKAITGPAAADTGVDDKGGEAGTADKKKTQKAEAPFQVFVMKGDDDDPEIIIKAGAKMKKARLNQFKKAVETLMSLLKELEGEQQSSGKDAKDKKGVKKSDELSVNEKLVKGFELLESKLGEKVAEVVKAALTPVTKRLDEFENIVPPGAGDSDPTETKKDEVKKKESLWSSVFR